MVLAKTPDALPLIRDEFNSRLTRVELPRGFTTFIAPFETRFEYFARNTPFASRTSSESSSWPLVVMMLVIAGLFVLLPTVNLVNLNVSRILERSSEIGVRKAFGAPTGSLVWQFVVENIILTLGGAALAFVLAALVLRAFNASGIAPYAQLTINLRVFAYGVLMAVLFGLISGVYPAWRMARLHPVSALRGAKR
jgi:putative ABC transport system permease protein